MPWGPGLSFAESDNAKTPRWLVKFGLLLHLDNLCDVLAGGLSGGVRIDFAHHQIFILSKPPWPGFHKVPTVAINQTRAFNVKFRCGCIRKSGRRVSSQSLDIRN